MVHRFYTVLIIIDVYVFIIRGQKRWEKNFSLHSDLFPKVIRPKHEDKHKSTAAVQRVKWPQFPGWEGHESGGCVRMTQPGIKTHPGHTPPCSSQCPVWGKKGRWDFIIRNESKWLRVILKGQARSNKPIGPFSSTSLLFCFSLTDLTFMREKLW